MYDRSALKMCGNVMIFFALFVTINSYEMSQLRAKLSPRAANHIMIALIENVKECQDIQQDIANRFKNEELKLNANDVKTLHQLWTTNIFDLWSIFITSVHDQFVTKLKDYCTTFLEIINGRISTSLSAKLNAEEIKMLAFSEYTDFYHLISFLSSHVTDVSGILGVVYFFQSWSLTVEHHNKLYPDNKITYPMNNVVVQVTFIMNQLRPIKPKENKNETVKNPKLDQRSLSVKLEKIRKDITNFVKHFQVKHIPQPILDPNPFFPMMTATIFDDKSSIVLDMLTNESCRIEVSCAKK